MIHLQQIINATGAGTPRGAGSFTDNDLGNWTNDFGVTMDLVGLTLGIRVLPVPNVASVFMRLELQLSFGNVFGPLQEIARALHSSSWRTDVAPVLLNENNVATNMVLGNFRDSIVEIPTTRGVVSVDQEQPRSKVFLHAQQEIEVVSGVFPFHSIRYIANLYLKRQ